MPASALVMFNDPELCAPEKREASARRIFKRQLSPTDESNPYKKKYLSYTKNRGNIHSVPFVVKTLDFSPRKQRLHTTVDKENKLTVPNDVQPRCSNISQQTAKHLVNKAYKIKRSKKTPKQRPGARPRRKSKSKYDNDFIYDPPRKKQKVKGKWEDVFPHNSVIEDCPDKKPPSTTDQGGLINKCELQNESNRDDFGCDAIDGEVIIGIAEVTKLKRKKARMKFANEYPTSGVKKTVKMKNHSTIRTHDSGYKIATVGDISMKNVKKEPISPDISNDNKSEEVKLEQKNFTDIFLNFCKEKDQDINPQSPDDMKASFTDLFLQDEDGNYTCLNKTDPQNQKMKNAYSAIKIRNSGYEKQDQGKLKMEEKDGGLCDTILAETTLNSIYDRTAQLKCPVSDSGKSYKAKNDIPEEKLTKKKESKNPLRLKIIERNGKVQFLNFNNQILTFCGCCANCKRSVDCGKCKYCKNAKRKKAKGLLPCWMRRCLSPYVGDIVRFPSKASNSEEIKKQDESPDTQPNMLVDKDEKDGKDKLHESKLEKIEACVISDNAIPAKADENGEMEFHVQRSVKRQRKLDRSINSDVDVFTGISPMKRKLRSTMNELMKQERRSSTSLPRIGFGPETLAKIPWPHDNVEDAAWVSGHHICLTSPIECDLPDLCFLCGSAGKGKMLICTMCSEMFHPYCLDVDPIDNKNWCCDRCKRCVVCGFKGNLLMCDRCHDCYHADCLGPFYQRDTEGDEETWYCGKCVKCTKCNQRRAGKEKASKWMYNFTMCEDCGVNWKKGNYCPVCQKIFGDNDHHLKMMCCCNCERWLHMECEGISVDDYEILTELPETIPYVCKLCSGKSKETMPWYKEVQEELNSGFLKVYYDVTDHRDLRLVQDRFGKYETVAACLRTFDLLLETIKDHKYASINDFYIFLSEAIETLSFVVKKVVKCNSSHNAPNVRRVKIYFESKVVEVFPWFSPEHNVKSELKTSSPHKFEPELLQYLNQVISHDHKYFKTDDNRLSASSEDEWAFNVILKEEKSRKICDQVDMRRCILCNHLGDGEECNTGRLLYAGANEWVHINCALWSAEVYEDDQGRLKHVYDALKRGNKVKCDYCDELGATIGCCWVRCLKSYHFYCACKSSAVLLEDKKMYCDVHACKAREGSILKSFDLHVPRRVVVDLSRFKSLRRVQRGLNPKSISVYCGSFSLLSLGYLTEHSDVKQTLIPIGYKISRNFWSSKQPTRRCKYYCEVQMLNDNPDKVVTETASKPSISETLTYCHDALEWESIKKRTSCTCGIDNRKHKSKKGMKRKIGCIHGCEKCIANRRFIFHEHSDFIAMLKRNRLVTKVDHNFFPLKTERLLGKSKNKNENTHASCHSLPNRSNADADADLDVAPIKSDREIQESPLPNGKYESKCKPSVSSPPSLNSLVCSTVNYKLSNSSSNQMTNIVSAVGRDAKLETNTSLCSQVCHNNLPSLQVISSVRGTGLASNDINLMKPVKNEESANSQSNASNHDRFLNHSVTPINYNRSYCSDQFSNGYIPIENEKAEMKKTMVIDVNKMRTNLFNKLSSNQSCSSAGQKAVTPQYTHQSASCLPVKVGADNGKAPLDVKRDKIFRQLKDYLTKNPSVVNFVGNVTSKESGNNVPVVNLTEPKSKRDSVCYSVYLPEHLWNDLIEAGIAKNDIQKILTEHRKQPCSKESMRHTQNDNDMCDTRNDIGMCGTRNDVASYKFPHSSNSHKFPHSSNSISSIVPPNDNNKKSFCAKPKPSILSHLLPKVLTKAPGSPAAKLTGLPTLLPKVEPISSYSSPLEGMSNLPPLQPISATIPNNYNCYQYCTTLPNSHLLVNNSMNYNIHTLYNYNRPLSIIPSYQLAVNNTRQKTVPVASHLLPNDALHCYTSHTGQNHTHSVISDSPSKDIKTSVSSAGQMVSPSSQLTQTTPQPNSIRFPSFIQKNAVTETPPSVTSVECTQIESTPMLPTSVESTTQRKYRKRIKNVSDAELGSEESTPVNQILRLEDRSICGIGKVKSGPVMRRKKEKLEQDTEVDLGTFDPNLCGENFVDSSLILPCDQVNEPCTKNIQKKSNLPKKQRRNYAQSLRKLLDELVLSEKKRNESNLLYVLRNEDGFECESKSLIDLWRTLIGEINDRRVEINYKPFPVDLNDAYEFFGVTKEFIAYLVEQLPGGHKCRSYKFQHHLPCLSEDDLDLPLNPSGCARGEKAIRKAENDMFAWLVSPYRLPPKHGEESVEDKVLGGMQDLPVAMKYRSLKNTSKDHVGVFGSRIQGRGLFCKKTIEQSDMIIEYSGELIRASLTDRREEFYEKQGIGCYMFRIDEFEVVDATMKGNAARFINHSCEPNCYSKIIQVDGAKKIVIYALRRINVGEELTYDYKFTQEDDKLPCYCGSKKCRKYMN